MLQRGVAVLLCLNAAALAAEPAAIERRFAELKKNPLELYAFLYKMPKGADLHNHLAGAVYAESFLESAANQHLCVDKAELAVVASPPCMTGQVDAATTRTDNALRDLLINSFSMRNFVPGRESAHDHFFATFGKFGVSSSDLIAGVVQRAADQNESYMELMALSGGGAGALGRGVTIDENNFAAAQQQIEKAGLAAQVQNLKQQVDRMEARLGCRTNPSAPICSVHVSYVYQVLRENPPEHVFAQVMAGFALAAADPRVVAVNFVQAEDGYLSMRDYHLHMKMVDFAHSLYPKVHITLHAGELAPGLVRPDGLLVHIREAVELGHAERIGHGVDLMYEKDPGGLLREMRERKVDVEINLTSNDVILGVKGDEHPLPIYRKNAIPVTLSTDDEGVNRSTLTAEFERAVLTYHLSYAELKEIVRNSIEYSFAPGDGYWKDRKYVSVTGACVAGRKTAECRAYLEKNEKAWLGANLEDRLADFEHGVN